MMDCDTTGIEPDIALIKYKKLVGGGMLKIVNQHRAARAEAAGLRFARSPGDRRIPRRARDHRRCAASGRRASGGLRLRLQAARRLAHDPLPGPSQDDGRGAAVHLGRDFQDHQHARRSDVEEVAEAYVTAWKLGLKAVAIYRDGSKRTQPLNTGKSGRRPRAGFSAWRRLRATVDEFRPHRRKLPDERKSITHKFDIAGHEGYITVGMYEDGTPGEIFVSMSKQGSTISGLMDSFATAISYALQYGVPLQFLVDKFAHMRFEPSGFTKNPQIPVRQIDRRLPVPMARLEVPRRAGAAAKSA